MVEGVWGEGVGDAEERGESSGVAQGCSYIPASSDPGGGAGAGIGFDGKAEM